jgi:nickel-dependent lactate racemase
MIVNIPYGKTLANLDLPEDDVAAVLFSLKFAEAKSEEQVIEEALYRPIGAKHLKEAASGKRNICIVVSDYTRATPNKVLLPALIRSLKDAGLEASNIRILVAYGLHEPAPKELAYEFLGKEILEEIEVLDHDAEDECSLVYIGKTTFETRLSVNRVLLESDLAILTGLIEPHFFAGYSGGRKSILPGVSSKEAIFNNHGFKMLVHPLARYGTLSGNPVHEDMVEAAKMVPTQMYLLNVVIDKRQKIVGAFTGDIFEAHLKGVGFIDKYIRVKAPSRADIVVTSNGGYPLDRDLYQAVKGMSTGEMIVRKGGVIIVFAECIDGVGRGHEEFYNLIAGAKSPQETLDKIRREEPIKDQWEAQILARILLNANVILVTKNIKHSVIEEMHMIPASGPEEAIKEAYKIVGKGSKIIVVPEGPYVIPEV